MPGYEYLPDKNALGLGSRRPLPNNVLSRGPLAPHLAAMASREQARQAQGALRPPGPIVPNGWSPTANPALRRPDEGFMPGEYRATHPTGGIDSSPGHPGLYGVSGAGGYAQGLTSMAGRNQLERNLDNEQVNTRLGINAAMAGHAAPPFRQYVAGSDSRAIGPAANYARAFPSSAAHGDPLVDAHMAGVLGTAPRAGAMTGTAPAQPGAVGGAIARLMAQARGGHPGGARPSVPIPTPPPMPLIRGPIPQLSPRAADPAAVAALPPMLRHFDRTSFGSGGRSFQVPPGAGPQINGTIGSNGVELDPVAQHTASVERERQHMANGNFAAAEGEQNYRKGLQDTAALKMAITRGKMAEDASRMGVLPRLMAGGVENGTTTPDMVRREQEREQRMTAMAALVPHWREHVLRASEGGDPMRALQAFQSHGHDDLLGGPNSALVLGLLRDEYGPEAIAEAGKAPWFAESEQSARLRSFLNGQQPTAPNPGAATAGRVQPAIPTPPGVPPISVPPGTLSRRAATLGPNRAATWGERNPFQAWLKHNLLPRALGGG